MLKVACRGRRCNPLGSHGMGVVGERRSCREAAVETVVERGRVRMLV